MGNVVSLDDMRPHTTTTVECQDCQHKWLAVYPTGTKALECPGCHNAVNEYGTRVLLNWCKTCGTEFTVCPLPENPENWLHCLAPECESYDESRDIDDLFD